MKNITNTIILAVAVAAMAALLLTGCQTSNKKEIPQTSAQKESVIDTTEEDRPSTSGCGGGKHYMAT